MQGSGGAMIASTTSRLRQRLLVLYTQNNCPTSEVVAWSEYDGTGRDAFADLEERPYHDVVAAMRDGWRVIKFPDIKESTTDSAYVSGPLENEFVLERLEEI
jgi:hypothetical protein